MLVLFIVYSVVLRPLSTIHEVIRYKTFVTEASRRPLLELCKIHLMPSKIFSQTSQKQKEKLA